MRAVVNRLKPLIAPVASAGLLFYSFVPEWGFILALGSLVPLFRSVILDPRWFAPWLFAAVFSACYFFWLNVFSPLAPVCMTIVGSTWIFAGIVPVILLARAARPGAALLILPFSWTAAEWLRSLGPYGCEWGAIGCTQYGSLIISAFAAYGGIWLVSFLVIASNAVFTWMCLDARSPRWLIAVLFAGLLWVASPFTGLPREYSAAGRFFLVQTNVSPYPTNDERERQMRDQLAAAAAESAAAPARVIVLPETLFSSAIIGLAGSLTEEPSALLRGFLAPGAERLILVGAIEFEDSKMYNAAILLDGSGTRIASYRKRHLVPFGETIPWLERFEWAQAIGHSLGTPFFSAGQSAAPLAFGGTRAGILICFEGTFSRLVAESARNADVLINISNDAWSTSDFGHEQHFRFLRFRAIETGLPVIRVGNSGPSALFAPNGELIARIWDSKPGVLDLAVYAPAPSPSGP